MTGGRTKAAMRFRRFMRVRADHAPSVGPQRLHRLPRKTAVAPNVLADPSGDLETGEQPPGTQVAEHEAVVAPATRQTAEGAQKKDGKDKELEQTAPVHGFQFDAVAARAVTHGGLRSLSLEC